MTAPPAGQTDSLQLTAEGSQFFLARQYEKAINSYARALEFEKKQEKLSGAQWRLLIDNLSMAYGMTGKLAEAEEVPRYGLSKVQDSLEKRFPIR